MRIGSLILFKDGYCYQSYSWNLFRPLGKLQNVIDHLDKYLIDEIIILRPVRDNDNNKSLISDLDELRKIKSSSPISFGGGIRNIEQLNLLKDLPIERFIFSSALFQKNETFFTTATKKFGKQAIVGLIPFKLNESLSVFNSELNLYSSIENINNIDYCDEIILYDCLNEGKSRAFNKDVLNKINFNKKKLIYSGGVSKMTKYFKNMNIPPCALAIENSILHKEFSKMNFYEKM